MGFTKDHKGIISNAPKGSLISITQIRAKLTPNGEPGLVAGDLVIELK